MSLSQLWVVGPAGSTKQTVEAGWQVYPDKWAANSAGLFIYYTTAGYSSGSGCYNLDCSGFVQVANNVYLGVGFDHYSTSGGTQWGFELQYKRDPRNGNWWLFYRGPGAWIPVGYYPHSLFGAGQLLPSLPVPHRRPGANAEYACASRAPASRSPTNSTSTRLATAQLPSTREIATHRLGRRRAQRLTGRARVIAQAADQRRRQPHRVHRRTLPQ